MGLFRVRLLIALAAGLIWPGTDFIQAQSPASGEITVQLVQGLDSATNPRGMSQGRVTKSTNPAVPVGSTALMGLSSGASGGYTVTLLRLGIGGQIVPAASSDVETAPDFFNKTQEKLRAGGQPKDAAKGDRVFLPERMMVRFTLEPVPVRAAVAAPVAPPVPIPVPARVVPRHPAPTVVDLAPALPGAPPLRASRAANDGCWWEPLADQSLQFELPVQHCSNAANDPVFQETATGLSFGFHRGDAMAVGFTVLSKRPTQSLETAVKAEFLKSPTERASCAVKKYSDLGSFQSYSVVALHARNTTCAGLYVEDSDATESTTFFYNPAESKTKYLRFTGEALVVYPFDLQGLHFVEQQSASAGGSAVGTTASPAAGTPAGGGSAALPAGPTAPVNRFNVRGISVRMGRGQILAAGKAAGMVVLEDAPQQLKLADPTASGRPVGEDSGPGGSGLVLLINLKDNAAVTVNVSEQGAMHGEVFADLCKKWGKPPHLPSGYNSELGAGDKATWGDKKTVYADYNPSIYSYGAQSVTIYDAVALAPHIPARKGVPM